MQGAETAVANSGKAAKLAKVLCRCCKGAVKGAVQGTLLGAAQGAVQGAVQRAVLCFPRWEPSVPTFRNWKFFAMVTCDFQVGKHKFQPLGTGSSLQW